MSFCAGKMQKTRRGETKIKNLSTKKCKHKKRQAMERAHKTKEYSFQSPAMYSDEPLMGMVVKKKNVFAPRVIDYEIISFAGANQACPGKSQILFKPLAVKQLHGYIDWGKSTKRNVIEQQGILLGTVYQTSTGFSAIVEAVLLSDAIGNQVYVESAHSDWSRMNSQMDELNQTRKRKLVKIGWWHTHPNMGIFMSGTDKATQSNYFYKDWQFAVVLNPQDKKWGAFVGENAEPCVGCFLNNNVFKLKVIDELADKKMKKEAPK